MMKHIVTSQGKGGGEKFEGKLYMTPGYLRHIEICEQLDVQTDHIWETFQGFSEEIVLNTAHEKK